LSAHRKDTASAVEGLAAGADEYLEAPYVPLRLVAQVARLLERARLEAHYRDLVEQTSDIIYTHDLEGRLTSINAAGVVFTGHKQEELIGQHVGVVLGLRDSQAQVESAIRRLRSEGTQQEQLPVTDASGRERWLEFNQSLICDRTGAALGVRGIARDITRRKRIEADLRRSEERYRALIESANDIIYTLALDGQFTSLNRAGERITGYTFAELAAQTWRVLVAPEYMALTEQMLARKLAGQETITFYELEIITKDGQRVPLELSTQLIHESGGATSILGVARDITERRQAETERRAMLTQQVEFEKMRSLGQLSAGVAHNFNNALAAILGRTQLREVFVNLILNALEAMPEGGAVECRERKADEQLSIEIADTGLGIAPDLQSRIFEPFFTTKGPHGSGLGLAVSYSIIKRHSGEIEVA